MKKTTTKLASALLALIIALSLFPVTAFAAPVNDWHPVYSDLENYGERERQGLNDARPEVKEWVLDNLGRPLGGCQYTPMTFCRGVFGVFPPLSLEPNYYTDGEIYGFYWRFIPYTEGMAFESGDILIEKGIPGAEYPGHFSLVVAHSVDYIDFFGNNYAILIESNFYGLIPNAQLNTLYLHQATTGTTRGGYKFVGVLRPDFAHTIANNPRPPFVAPNIDTASEWARDGVNAAVDKNFVPIDLQDNYTAKITRAEFCSLAVNWLLRVVTSGNGGVWNLEEKYGIPERMQYSFEQTFSDNTEYPYSVLAAYRIGMISGVTAPTATTPGKFNPNGLITRQEAAVMIANMCKVTGIGDLNPPTADFTDLLTAGIWAQSAISFVRANGIMSGTSTTLPTFSPHSNYTREQSIITFMNILNNVEKPAWADVWK